MAHFVEELNAHPTLMQRIGHFFESMALTASRAHEVERLTAMTDEQLAARGLRRDQIAQHVFRDLMYT